MVSLYFITFVDFDMCVEEIKYLSLKWVWKYCMKLYDTCFVNGWGTVHAPHGMGHLNLIYQHLMTPCGGKDIGKKWIRSKYLVTWWKQAINLINIDSRLLAFIPVHFCKKNVQNMQAKIILKIH